MKNASWLSAIGQDFRIGHKGEHDLVVLIAKTLLHTKVL